MRLYRGISRQLVDTKQPDQLVREWKQRGLIRLDGTIAGTDRITRLYLAIDEEDVIGLVGALFERHKERERKGEVVSELLLNLKQQLSAGANDSETIREVRRLTTEYWG